MKGSPMQRNFGNGSPMRDDKKKKETGSDQEVKITDDRDYSDSSTGEVKSARMVRLERAQPPKDSPEWKNWNAAYLKEKARFVEENR